MEPVPLPTSSTEHDVHDVLKASNLHPSSAMIPYNLGFLIKTLLQKVCHVIASI